MTGANSGIGLVAARELSRHGARVVLACRDMEKGRAAAERVRASGEGAQAEAAELDLASLDSIRAFAQGFLAEHGGVDLLVNNAGVMASPRRTTEDGFELQFGTNHLGHFALTGLLLESMQGREDARVVTLSSTAARQGRIDLDDLQGERRYRRWRAYCQSKLANQIFALELDRRLRAADWRLQSIAAHPGYAATNLQSSGPPLIDTVVMKLTNALVAQTAEMGALPTLFAATEPGVEGGSYIGPGGLGQQRGHPIFVTPVPRALDREVAERLWAVSGELTGVRYPV